MEKYPIDRLLCALERRSGLVGVDIDSNPDYIFICEAVTALEFSEGSVSY